MADGLLAGSSTVASYSWRRNPPEGIICHAEPRDESAALLLCRQLWDASGTEIHRDIVLAVLAVFLTVRPP